MKSDKVIFFDCYQTLLDVRLDQEQQKVDKQEAWKSFVYLLSELGVHVEVANFLAFLEKHRTDFYSTKDKKIHHHDFFKLVEEVLKTDLKAEISSEELATLVYEYRKIARGYAHPYPKVAETLAQLSRIHMLALVSYTQASFTQLELREFGIEQYFSHFIYSSDIGLVKEAPGFYEKCLEIVGKQATDCVMIGDHYREDVLASRKAGLHAIWVRNPATLDKFADVDISMAGESVSLEDFDRLPKIIEEIFIK